MTEKTAMVLAGLSHSGSGLILSLPIVFGMSLVVARSLQTRARANANVQALRISTVVRQTTGALFVVSLLLFGVAASHMGCAVLVGHSHWCLSNNPSCYPIG